MKQVANAQHKRRLTLVDCFLGHLHRWHGKAGNLFRQLPQYFERDKGQMQASLEKECPTQHVTLCALHPNLQRLWHQLFGREHLADQAHLLGLRSRNKVTCIKEKHDERAG